MRKIKFYGASDDLMEISGGNPGEPDEFVIKDGEIGSVDIHHGDDAGLTVIAKYMDNGTWMIGIHQLSEDIPIPEWPMEWTSLDYSAVLEIMIPEDAVLVSEDWNIYGS